MCKIHEREQEDNRYALVNSKEKQEMNICCVKNNALRGRNTRWIQQQQLVSGFPVSLLSGLALFQETFASERNFYFTSPPNTFA